MTTERFQRHAGWIVASLLGIAATCLYWYHAAPSFTFRDSAVFAMAAATYGIPHPPGASTWVILAGTFGRLCPVEDWAHATNLFCGLMGGITVGFVCLYIYLLLPRLCTGLSVPARLGASVSGALILAASPAFIEQSITTEQYTLMTAINMAMLLVAIPILNLPPGKIRNLLFVLEGILWGLAHGNHPSQIHLVLFSAFLALASNRAQNPSFKTLFTAFGSFIWIFGGFLLGSLVFLWLPFRSLANPLLDWGNVETPRRLLWAIRREQWHGRPLSECPDGFVWEWMKSYRPFAELGIAGVVLAIGGLVPALKRIPAHVGLISLVVFPFLAGILYGHMTQEGMSVSYIRFYRVSDWHLPLYMAGGIFGGFAIGWLCMYLSESRGTAAGNAVAGVLTAAFCLFAALSLQANSLRSITSHETYIRHLLEPLPADAMIVLSSDNLSFNLGYHKYFQDTGESRAILWSADTVCRAIVKAMDRNGWDAGERADYYRNSIDNREKNMLNAPLPTAEEFAARPLYGEFDSDNAQSHRYLLPAGFLVRAVDRPTSDSEFLAEEEAFRKLPQVDPETVFYHHERSAWSQLWHRRADVFYARSLWQPAARAYRIALEFQPGESLLNYRLGECLDRLGLPDEAAVLYRRAIELNPYQSGPYLLLGMAEARSGNLTEAKRLIERELELNPENSDARRILEAVKRDLQQ